MSKISDCKILTLPKITDARGNLTFLESGSHVPFDFKRIFYIYDIPSGESRGAHAHREQHQFLVCLAGGYDVHLDDGRENKIVTLNRPWMGLHIPPMIWASEINFNPGSIALVFASDVFREPDYIRDYETFLNTIKSK